MHEKRSKGERVIPFVRRRSEIRDKSGPAWMKYLYFCLKLSKKKDL